MTRIIGAMMLALATVAAAQEKVTPLSAVGQTAVAEPAGEPTPQVSVQDKQIIQTLDLHRTGYALAIAALQEKLDAANAELNRAIQRLQAAQPGHDLAPGLVYVKKAVAKKETPK